jgi:hypothetical protein
MRCRVSIACRDAAEPVRVAALQLIAEHCPHNAAVLGLMVGRCCDPGAKVRAAATKLVRQSAYDTCPCTNYALALAKAQCY